MSINNSITYRKVGDYNIPNLTFPPEEANIKLGKWGMLHNEYLQKYKPVVCATLFAQGNLWPYLADIDTHAQQMFDTLVEQMKQKEGITEQLKDENQMEWIRRVVNVESRVRETIIHEIIYK